MSHAAGAFDVTPLPEPPISAENGVTVGRMVFEKVFHGSLQATSVVHMTYATPPVETSAAYVAVEQIAGSLDGRKGSFVVLHVGVSSATGGDLSVTIAPDSGTGELTGISGSMTLTNDAGEHSYTLDYDLA